MECVSRLLQHSIHAECVSLTVFLLGNRAGDAASWEMNQQKFRYCCSGLFRSPAFCSAQALLSSARLFYRRGNVLLSLGKLPPGSKPTTFFLLVCCRRVHPPAQACNVGVGVLSFPVAAVSLLFPFSGPVCPSTNHL